MRNEDLWINIGIQMQLEIYLHIFSYLLPEDSLDLARFIQRCAWPEPLVQHLLISIFQFHRPLYVDYYTRGETVLVKPPPAYQIYLDVQANKPRTIFPGINRPLCRQETRRIKTGPLIASASAVSRQRRHFEASVSSRKRRRFG